MVQLHRLKNENINYFHPIMYIDQCHQNHKTTVSINYEKWKVRRYKQCIQTKHQCPLNQLYYIGIYTK